MINLPEDITANDMAQWLEGGWFFFEVNGTFVPAAIVDYPHSDNGPYQVRLLDGTYIADTERSRIRPHWPVCGGVNVEEARMAVHVERLQKKQFCRTYNHRMVTVSVPGRTFVGRHVLEQFHAGGERVVKGLFAPSYFSLTDILSNKFPKGWRSCALSPMVILFKQKPRHIIFYRGEVCGYLRNRVIEDVDSDMLPKLMKHFNGEAFFST